MKQNRAARIASIVCAGTVALAALTGCAAPNAGADQQQAENRQYMAQVNQSMEDLQERLADFTDAVSRGDVVGMKTQADNAYRALDDLGKVEAPAGFEDVQKDYLDGTADLKEALNAYIDLYTEIDSATDDQPFDWASYDERVSAIKQQYDEGVSKLQAGDAKVGPGDGTAEAGKSEN